MTRYAFSIVVLFSFLVTGSGSVLASDWSLEKTAVVDEKISHFYERNAQAVPQGARTLTGRRAINPVDQRSLRTTQELKPHNRAPSIAISVGVGSDGEDGRLLLAKGYGEAGPGIKADEHTLYHIGSLTKQFTAAVLLDLIDKKAISRANGRRVELDMPLPHLFFGVEHWSKEGEPPITIRRLLTMTSNLPNYTRRPLRDLNPWGAVKAPRLLAAIKKLSPFGWPESFEYSNTSYFLLAQIIESLSLEGETELYSYSQRLRAHAFKRAGMNATRFVGEHVEKSILALPNDARGPVFTKPDWLKGSADVVSSVADMYSWNESLMSGRIINAQNRALIFSEAARVTPLEWYGMGWFVKPGKKQDVFYHSGTVPGYTSFNMIAREHETSHWVCVTILTNAGQVEGLDRLALDIASLASN